MMTRTTCEFHAGIFHALAHPTRVAMVLALRGGELTAGTLMQRLQIEQANTSQHLAVLRSRSIVTTRKSGNQVYYSLRDPLILQLLDTLRVYQGTYLSQTAGALQAMHGGDAV